MTIAGVDIAALTFRDYAIGAVYAVLGTFVVTGAEMVFDFELPSLVASAAGAAIGIAAWFVFLLKRKS
ncbi:hypothetical protein NIM87_02220 [Devosia sp. XJ19-1]|uniref:Uncharacterized protein n=1 Tax=Devosia ureilytica TaxID=2952754 RepID=A0A9Q4FR26_9HYPH|nr:hypothetical protein [Devosia ureilytica]MCP8882311.1 hypothetical protein [Devosia ureilytica]MCP8885803.1 hypothetical protein [Devosia ureilytica]